MDSNQQWHMVSTAKNLQKESDCIWKCIFVTFDCPEVSFSDYLHTAGFHAFSDDGQVRGQRASSRRVCWMSFWAFNTNVQLRVLFILMYAYCILHNTYDRKAVLEVPCTVAV